MRRGDWIQTFSGGAFWPLDPMEADVSALDIAAALSKQCRFAGHCRRFYSVAEHSVLIWRVARARGFSLRDQRAALLHDASEAYLVDIPRPVKPGLTNYHEIEDRLMSIIARRFDFKWPLPSSVKELDLAILSDERLQNMAPMAVDGLEWGNTAPPLNVLLQFWAPDKAFGEFVRAAAECGCEDD
jgi:hypothetical protein